MSDEVPLPHSVVHMTGGDVSGSGQFHHERAKAHVLNMSVAQLPSGAPCTGHATQATCQHTLIVFALIIARPGE